MPGPWEDYAPPAKPAGPWDDYAQAEPSGAGDVAKSFAIGVPKGVIGLAGLPGDVSNLVGQGVNALGNFITGGNQSAEEFAAKRARALGGGPDIAAPGSAAIRGGVEKVTGPLYEPKTLGGQYAQTVGEFLPAAMAGPGSIARRAIAGAAIPGVTSEAAGQLTQGTPAEPYARFLGALGPQLATQGTRALLASPKGGAARAAEVANLEAEGVRDLTAGQRTGSTRLQYLEQGLGDITGAGTRQVERGQEQFTRAALRRAGEDAPRATPDVIDGAFTRIGNQFDRLAANNTLAPDKGLLPQIQNVVKDYDLMTSATNKTPAVRAFQNEITNAVYLNKQGIPGAVYQSLRSRIEAAARQMPPGDPATHAIRDMKNALDSAMERHLARIGSSDLGAWQQARREYRNLLPIERAATAAGSDAATGLISPSALRNAVVGQSRRGYARGTGDLARLARSGEAVMRTLPNSGTAQRSYMMSLPGTLGIAGTGLVTGNPAMLAAGLAGAAGPPIAGRALMSRPVQNFLGRPQPFNYGPAATSIPDMSGGGQPQPQFAGPQTPFERSVAADLQRQFPNETPEQIDQRVQAITGAMTSGQTFLPEVQAGLRINQPNWERFLAAQPRSKNIEDRRTRP